MLHEDKQFADIQTTLDSLQVRMEWLNDRVKLCELLATKHGWDSSNDQGAVQYLETQLKQNRSELEPAERHELLECRARCQYLMDKMEAIEELAREHGWEAMSAIGAVEYVRGVIERMEKCLSAGFTKLNPEPNANSDSSNLARRVEHLEGLVHQHRHRLDVIEDLADMEESSTSPRV